MTTTDIGITTSLHDAMPTKRPAPAGKKRKIVRFDDYFHTDAFPIASSKHEFRIFVPLVNGKVEATVLDISRTFFLFPPPPMLYPQHIVYGAALHIDPPNGFTDCHVYVLGLDDMTMGLTTYDKNGKEIGTGDLKLKKFELSDFGFDSPVHAVRIFRRDKIGSVAVVRTQAWV